MWPLRFGFGVQRPQQVFERQLQSLRLGLRVCGRQVFEWNLRALRLRLRVQGRLVLWRQVLQRRGLPEGVDTQGDGDTGAGREGLSSFLRRDPQRGDEPGVFGIQGPRRRVQGHALKEATFGGHDAR
jgi:hypothetical protein